MKWKIDLRKLFQDNVAQRDISIQNMKCEKSIKKLES